MKIPKNDPSDGRGRWSRQLNDVQIKDGVAYVAIQHRRQALTMLMDEVDLKLIGHRRIRASWDKRAQRFYATVTIPDDKGIHKTVKLHRLITAAPRHLVVDHKNNDGLDNRRQNIRVCSLFINALNRHNAPRSSTGIRGVQVQSGKFRARLRYQQKWVNLGTFTDKALAEKAVNAFLGSVL